MFIATNFQKEAEKLVGAIKHHWNCAIDQAEDFIDEVHDSVCFLMSDPEDLVDVKQVFLDAIKDVNPNLVLVDVYDTRILKMVE